MSRSYSYPPCLSEGVGCADPKKCCSDGYKYIWPELVGKHGNVAKAIIERDNPLVTVLILLPGMLESGDFCCNRVYFYVDRHGIVTKDRVPQVG